MFFSKATRAQSFANNGHYFLNQLEINPAYAGFERGLNLFANYRSQWLGVTGAPQSPFLAIDLSLPQFNSGVGLVLQTDLIGIERKISAELSYSYRLDIRKSRLAFGLGFGLENTQIDGAKIITPSGEYLSGIDHQDNILPIDQQSANRFLLSAGVYYAIGDFKAGLSVGNLIDQKSSYEFSVDQVDAQSDTISVAQSLKLNKGRTMQLFMKYNFAIGENFNLAPSVQILTNFNQLQTDISILFDYNQFIFTGFSVRGYNKASFDALIPIVGVKVRRDIGVFYSYEIGMNRLQQAANGTHEVSISYFLSEKKLFGGNKVINNPRFL